MTTREERIQARVTRNQWAQAEREEREDEERKATVEAAARDDIKRHFNALVAVARAAEMLNAPLFAERDALDLQIGALITSHVAINVETVARRNQVLPDALLAGRTLGQQDELAILDGRAIEHAAITGSDDAAKWGRFIALLTGNGHVWIGDDGRGYVRVDTRVVGYQL